jgi:putative flippase GtrA
VALGGLFVNILALNAVLAVIVLPYKTIGQGIGILAGMSVNYLGFRYLVFRKSS